MRKLFNSERTETTAESRVTPIYFDSGGDTPIDLDELNALFYQHLVQEFGSNQMHRNLWPGETLLSIIQGMKKECLNIKDRTNRKRAARLIEQYKALYKTLINQ